jgi:DNA repair photolyase
MEVMGDSKPPHKGRGASSNPACRYDRWVHSAEDDGWGVEDGEAPVLATRVSVDRSRTVIARNRSPDIPFDRSVNPYRGCEHGCIYCYARPSHAHLGLSPGLDFETRLFAKPDAARLLAEEIRKPGYQCQPLALGTNTDPYQPIERTWSLTRQILQVLARCRHPVTIATKSARVERDIDLLSGMAERNLAEVFISVNSLDRRLARSLEPRAASPERRVQILERLAAAGIPCGVLVAPVIPALNDHELEAVLAACASAGATMAGYVLLRLPLEVEGLFEQWLEQHAPLKAKRVMALVRDCHGGKAYDARFGRRMTGTGQYAGLIGKRFELCCKRLGLNRPRTRLETRLFQPPDGGSPQLALF